VKGTLNFMSGEPTLFGQERWAATELGEALCLSSQRINQLVKEGVLPAPIDGRYLPRDAVSAYVRHLRQREAGKSQAGEAVMKMQLENQMRRIKLQRIAKELVPIAQIQKDWFECSRRVRDGFLNLPSRLSGPFASEVSQDKIFELFTREIHSVLTELANGHSGIPVTECLQLEAATDPQRSPDEEARGGSLEQESDNLPTFEEGFLDKGDEDPDDRFSTGD
jgi:hypothetical protein